MLRFSQQSQRIPRFDPRQQLSPLVGPDEFARGGAVHVQLSLVQVAVAARAQGEQIFRDGGPSIAEEHDVMDFQPELIMVLTLKHRGRVLLEVFGQ
jgi:hypothetical protein